MLLDRNGLVDVGGAVVGRVVECGDGHRLDKAGETVGRRWWRRGRTLQTSQFGQLIRIGRIHRHHVCRLKKRDGRQ